VPEPLTSALESVRDAVLAPERLVRAVAAGRRKGLPRPASARVELRPVDLKGGRRLLVASWDGVQTTTRHVEYGPAAAAEIDGLLAQPYGNWHVETVDETVQLRVTKKGEAQVHRSSAAREQRTSHDRAPRRLLAEDDPLFDVLGAVDGAGDVAGTAGSPDPVGAGADKRRQVDAFLRMLDPVVPSVADRPLGVVDLGCGNAALTLAAYRHLSTRLGGARLVGVDVKEQARVHNTEVAARLGWSEEVTFIQASIAEADVDPAPAQIDVVLALHACDTATDDALARAVRWATPVILAAPCCHHDIQRQLAASDAPTPYSALVRHGILRERFADTLTDAVRAELLRLLGYRVDVLEFVGSRHTPRNTLIRAVRTGAPPDPGRVSDYHALTAAWAITPRLEALLAPELEPVLAVAPGVGSR
jgi:SAM-dependent methyltransferase